MCAVALGLVMIGIVGAGCSDAGVDENSPGWKTNCGRIGQEFPYGYECGAKGICINYGSGLTCRPCAAPFFCDMNGTCTLHCSTAADCPAISGQCDIGGPQGSSCVDGVCVPTNCDCYLLKPPARTIHSADAHRSADRGVGGRRRGRRGGVLRHEQ